MTEDSARRPTDNEAKLNTDRELWREIPGDYYSPSIHIAEGGGIGLNVGGHVIVKPVRMWHELAAARENQHQGCMHSLLCWATDGWLCLLCHQVISRTDAAKLLQREHSVVTLIHLHTEDTP